MGIKDIFNRKGMTPRTPNPNIPAEYKRYICEMDIARNKTIDILNIYKQLHSLPELKPHFKDVDIGDHGDAYRMTRFAETVVNIAELGLQTQIQEEERIRKELAKMRFEYIELTNEAPNSVQQAFLDKQEQINKDTILAKARTNTEQTITSGYKSETAILELEKTVHELRKTAHQDRKTMVETQNSDEKIFAEDVVKKDSHQKLKKNPELAPSITKRLKSDVERINLMPPAKKNGIAKKPPVNGKHKGPESYPLTQAPLNKFK